MTSTPDRLKEATTQLLTERPASTVTLRDITGAADANVASVAYHFGSKEALVAQVVREALHDQADAQRQAFLGLSGDATLSELVRIWLGPALASAGKPMSLGAQVLRRQLGDSDPAVRAVMAEALGDVGALLIPRLVRLLPYLSESELHVRHLAVLSTLGGFAALAPMLPEGLDELAVGDQLLAFVVGGLAAPAASEGSG